MKAVAAIVLTVAFQVFFGLGSVGAQHQDKLVFAHYMVCCPRAGFEPTVDDFLAEMRDAATVGIDGFVLNCGGWSKEPRYKAFAAMLFEAARRYGPAFKLFFSADQVTADEAADMVVSHAGHPNYLRHQGRPVLSSFMGDAKWAASVRQGIQARSGENAFLVPFFYPPGRREVPTPSDVRWLVRESGDIDGFFYFGTAGTPGELANAIRLNARAWTRRDKLFMAGIGVYYRGLQMNYRIFESRGYEALVRQWMAAIESPTQWVELTTWNDWGEASYIAPLGDSASGRRWTDNWGYLLSHDGFLQAHRHFISWFKTGKEPTIETERLFYAFRLHLRHAVGRPSPLDSRVMAPDGARLLLDRIHFLTLLRSPAQLLVRVGKRSERIYVPAGLRLLSVAMQPGPVSIELTRNGRVIAVKDCEFPITDSENWSNFNIFTGELSVSKTVIPAPNALQSPGVGSGR